MLTASETGLGYGEIRDKLLAEGMDETEAKAIAARGGVAYGLISGFIEKGILPTQLSGAGTNRPGFGGWAMRVLMGGTGEMTEEEAQMLVMGATLHLSGLDADISWEGAIETGIMSFGGGAGMRVGSRAEAKRVEAAEAMIAEEPEGVVTAAEVEGVQPEPTTEEKLKSAKLTPEETTKETAEDAADLAEAKAALKQHEETGGKTVPLEEVAQKPTVESAVKAEDKGSEKGEEAETNATDALERWDIAHRSDRVQELFVGGNANNEVNAAFDRAAQNGGDFIPAHGMSKAPTAGQAFSDLLSMLKDGLRPQRDGSPGILDTNGLTASQGGDGSTGSGAAYRDGPFILVGSRGGTLEGNLGGLTAVLINPALAKSFESIKAEILAVRPGISVELFTNADKVVPSAPAAKSPAAAETVSKEEAPKSSIEETKKRETSDAVQAEEAKAAEGGEEAAEQKPATMPTVEPQPITGRRGSKKLGAELDDVVRSLPLTEHTGEFKTTPIGSPKLTRGQQRLRVIRHTGELVYTVGESSHKTPGRARYQRIQFVVLDRLGNQIRSGSQPAGEFNRGVVTIPVAVRHDPSGSGGPMLFDPLTAEAASLVAPPPAAKSPAASETAPTPESSAPAKTEPKKAVSAGEKEAEAPVTLSDLEKKAQDEGKPFLEVTSPRHKLIEADRRLMGVTGPDSPTSVTNAEQFAKARETGSVEKAMDIAADVLSNPRSMDTTESAAVTLRIQELKNEWNSKAKKNREETGEDTRRIGQEELSRVKSDIVVLQDALKKQGSKRGEELQSQKATVDQNLDLVSVVIEVEGKLGRQLDSEEMAALAKRVEALETHNAALEAELKRKDENMARAAINRTAPKTRSRLKTPAAQTNRLAELYGDINELLRHGCHVN